MKCIKTTANDLELKYNTDDFTLLWEYIGNKRSHGDCYYDESKYAWFEFDNDVSLHQYVAGKPVAIVCLTDNKFLPLSLHLSVIEVYTPLRGKGYGTLVLEYLLKYAKSMRYKSFTLQTHNDLLINFYKKFGFKSRVIDKSPIMRKYL